MHAPLANPAQPDRQALFASFFVALLLLAGCGSTGNDTGEDTAGLNTTTDNTTTDDVGIEIDIDIDTDTAESDTAAAATADAGETDTAETAEVAAAGLNLDLFFDGALAEAATTEPCTLSGGAEATCYRITVAGFPASHDIGPFCPTSTSDGPDAGGLWWDGDAVYDLDGAFITGLAEIYGDNNWQMFDEDGNVFVTETAEEFDLAARPDVDESLQNHCVEGRLEWLDNGEPVRTTVLIPIEPVAAGTATAPRGNQGVTLDGVVIANAAPVDAILGAYTIAAFDDCGAHFNPVDGYHMHGAVGCSELDEVTEGDTPMFGYALDGYPIHSPMDDNAAADLDECNGHTTEAAGYHYHANSAEKNQVLECLIGQTATGTAGGPDGGDAPEGAPARDDAGRPEGDREAGQGGPGGGPDLTEAAAALGVNADDLQAALGRPPFDFAAAAATLGISAADLEAALPAPPR